jgi:hypothetical protein
MSQRIYLLGDDDALTPMNEAPYDAEDLLQVLLADYPDLLAGDQMTPSTPRRWLLVKREMGVPDDESSGGRWSLDHLFLDQDGVPTLVEVKRSSDTRIRREVVGQMLDYAANAVAYWPVEQIRAVFGLRCEQQGLDASELMADFLRDSIDEEEYWQRVKTNLGAGRVRMVFAADDIPKELQRIVEFLNEQMDPAEVLAVEIRQFVGEGNRTLVPRVVGLTVEAQDRKGSSEPARQWDEAMFLDDLHARCSDAELGAANRILQWANATGAVISWGRGRVFGTFSVKKRAGDVNHPMFTVYSDGRIEIGFAIIQQHPPFTSVGLLRELMERLNSVDGVQLPADAIDRWPRTNLEVLGQSDRMTQFLEIWDWYCGQLGSND